jgi:predicted kinase
MLNTFEKFFGGFKTTKLWQDMEATCENSPWHREPSVAAHTQMIIDHYLTNFAQHRTPREQALTLLCILFHDTGKPLARKDKFTEERGNYKSFGGHEHISARIFEDYIVQNWTKWKKIKSTFGLDDSDMYLIMWVIENHLPHNFSHPSSLQNIRDQLSSEMFEYGALQNVYFDQIICDQAGRISDNQEKNMQEVIDFVTGINALQPDQRLEWSFEHGDRRELIMMIGASGSGKSSYCNDRVSKGYEYISLDAMRIDFAFANDIRGTSEIDVYKKSYDYCDTHRSAFKNYTDKQYDICLKNYKNIIVDNTNVNRKSRDSYVMAAKARGYRVIMVLFPINKDKLIDRAKTRSDKQVPISAVLDQYNRISMPWINVKHDADDIVIMSSNIDGSTV